MEIKDRVLQVIREELSGIPVTLETVVLNASGIDEGFQRNLIMRLEEEIGVEIPDEDAQKLNCVKSIVEYLTIKTTKEPDKKEEPKVEEPKVEEPKVEEKKEEVKEPEKVETKEEKKEEKKSE
jgi:acyl carrier protein